MAKNKVSVSLSGSGSFTVPPGVTVLEVYGIPRRLVPLAFNGGFTMVKKPGNPGLSVGSTIGPASPASAVPIAGPSGVVPVKNALDDIVSMNDTPQASNLTLALDKLGRAYAAGVATNGRMGNLLNTGAFSVPSLVLGPKPFIKVCVGANAGYGLTYDGAIYAWGLNANGQLGDGTVVPKSTPVLVSGGHSFIDMFAGAAHAGGLKANGELYTWGLNANGQLGDGTVVPKSTPVLVSGGLSFVQAISGTDDVGGSYTFGLAGNGNLYGWGRNQYAILTDIVNAARSTPVLITGGLSFSRVCVGHSAGSCAFGILSDGTAYAWGNNDFGKLGIASPNITISSPTLISGGHKWYEFTGGLTVSIGIRRPQGDIYGMGDINISVGGSTGEVDVPTSIPVWGAGYQPAGERVLLNRLTTTPGTVISYDTTNPGTYNDLVNGPITILYNQLVLEYFA